MSRRYFRNSALFAAAFIAAAATAAAVHAEKERREPIVVTANRMEAEQLGNIVTFTGDVTLKKEGLVLNTDSLVVFYDPPAKGIREIEARGSVVVRQEGRVAYAKVAVYTSADEKLVLTGDARVIENENEVGGDRIILFIRDNRSIVEGGSARFYQDKKTEEPKGKPARRQGK